MRATPLGFYPKLNTVETYWNLEKEDDVWSVYLMLKSKKFYQFISSLKINLIREMDNIQLLCLMYIEM